MAPSLDPFGSATAMLAALRDRQLSAVELLDLHLARIARYNPVLNAIVTLDAQGAHAAAAAADATRRRGEDAPLLGLPFTTKDTNDVAGMRTTAGVAAFADRVPTADAPVIARARAAGAVILGKTNVPPFAGDLIADNPVFGRTNNPWDLDRTPGGSTGGGAAALAAGLTPLEFGSDIAGSIRIPAMFCGVFGHKPSETALPRGGMLPSWTHPNAARTLAVMGPLARSADDLALAFDTVAGPVVGEEVAWRLAIPPARHDRLTDFRVAVLPWPGWVPLDSEIGATWERLAADLGRLGARLGTAQPEGFGDLHEHNDLFQRLMSAQASPHRPLVEREAAIALLRTDADLSARAAAVGADIAEYLAWHDRREEYRAAYRTFFRDWDVLLMPTTINPAFPHTRGPWSERTLTVNEEAAAFRLQIVPSGIATLSGQPATAFPMGLTRGGLPIGLQAVGPYLEDQTPIRFARLVEQEFGGFRAPPGYDRRA